MIAAWIVVIAAVVETVVDEAVVAVVGIVETEVEVVAENGID